jgi:hypothetical protein
MWSASPAECMASVGDRMEQVRRPAERMNSPQQTHEVRLRGLADLGFG